MSRVMKKDAMTLNELVKGEKAVVLGIHASKPLRQRMQMFGLIKDEILTLKAYSLGRQNLEIEIGSMLIALRMEEAKKNRN